MALRSSLIIGTAVGAAAAASVVWLGSRREAQTWTTVENVCADCHNDIDLAGNLSFEDLSFESVPDHPEIFEKVVRKLRGHLMPPPGAPQLQRADVDALVGRIETALDATPHSEVGHVRAQRLTRTEYAHAVEGLLGVTIDPVEFLPTEIEVEGFSNIASALTVSPAFIEQYVNVARLVAHEAVGEPVPKVAAAYFPPPTDDQETYVSGFPLGTRGGIRITHNFPADGEYRLTLKGLGGVGLYASALQSEHTVLVLLDKDEIFRTTIGGEEDLRLADQDGAPGRAVIEQRFTDIPLRIPAGPHELIVTFVERTRGISDEQIGGFGERGGKLSYSGAPRMPGISGGIDLVGPFDPAGIARTPSREKIFVCEPEVPSRERECAERIAAKLVERAFRRPVTDADLARLMPFFEQGRTGAGGFDEGIELLVAAVLASPDFLYRTITTPPDVDGDSFALNDYEIATRLSFFLWSQGPDDTLLTLASEGRLQDPAVLDAQVARMLDDPRADTLVTGFALPWLGLDDLDAVEPDGALFAGEFSDALREDFATEIFLFAQSVLLDDADVRTLLTGDYTFLNERLARHYGIDSVFGPQFRRVGLDDQTRFGLLGKGAVLLRTSYGDRTSPVLRGAWVLDKLMGTPPTPPPPGVETNLSVAEGEEPTTVRARLEKHRAAPNCQACHGAIDPYGLALENFSVTGRWRDVDREAKAPIDATTDLPGGQAVTGPAELTQSLLVREDQFVQALTEKAMMYALGRELEYYDMPAVRDIVHESGKNGYRFATIVAGIVQSDAFRRQSVAQE